MTKVGIEFGKLDQERELKVKLENCAGRFRTQRSRPSPAAESQVGAMAWLVSLPAEKYTKLK